MVNNETTAKCIDAYAVHKNLKLAANDVGIPWQTVYVHLRRAGVPVVGDKLRYGSDTDKLAANAEQLFMRHVPSAENQNTRQFQSKVDFVVGPFSVDVKASTKKYHSKKHKGQRWSFSIKKQEAVADFFVCYGFAESIGNPEITLLIPGEVIRRYTTISVSTNGGKWGDYKVDPESLFSFFEELKESA